MTYTVCSGTLNPSIPYHTFKTRRFYNIRLQKMSWPWNGVRGHTSLKVIESGIIRYIVYGFLLVFFSKFVPTEHRFWDIRLQKWRELENRVRGLSRSLEMSPCDIAHMTFYWCCIVTMFYLMSFLRHSLSKNVATLKSGSEVTQGHWEWYHSVDRVWFPISVL